MRALRAAGSALAIVLVISFVAICALLAYTYAGVRAGASALTGTIRASVREPVEIDRDSRGIPHIRARNERDMFFAQGFAEGCDRLFQIDVYRRLEAGRLAEVFGRAALQSDEEARVFDINGAVTRELAALGPRGSDNLAGFANGINAAMKSCPLPPEFRIMGYRPEPWKTTDTLLVGFATVINLADTWDDVLTREDIRRFGPARVSDAFFPITDPAYDSPIAGKTRAPVAPLPALTVRFPHPAPLVVAAVSEDREGIGSNDFAAGAALTATHRALLANDPHLQLRMPGIWYLVDISSPDYHVAGATLAGTPGVILGHNAHVAWGVTNGTVATTRIYRETFRAPGSDEYRAGNVWLRASHRLESFGVRFGKSVTRDYLATRHGFVFADRGVERYAAAWTALVDKRSAVGAFFSLGGANDVKSALRALDGYPGPPQNFVLADDRGDAAYALAGDVWRDSMWALGALDGPSAGAPTARDYVPPSALPRVPPSHAALVFTANDRTYGAGYPYRLTSNFEAPYRAARIAELLHARKSYDVDAFSAIQADVISLPERELAEAAAAAVRRKGMILAPPLRKAANLLGAFDGRFVEDSTAAVYASALRRAASERLVGYHLPQDLAARYLGSNSGLALVVLLRALRDKPKGWVPGDDFDEFLVDSTRDALAQISLASAANAGATWSDVGARIAQHPFSAFGFQAFNGTRFPGRGDAFSPHVQGPRNTQSFRAVWDVGKWDSGGIVIPQGESGQPGSPHYRDGAAAWLAGRLEPLPFSDSALAAAKVSTLTLAPEASP